MSKTILVTGANGFVGHHLVRELAAQDHTVVGVGRDEAPTSSNAGLLSRYIACDLVSADSVNQAISFEGIDSVIHLAGLANVGQSFAEPARFLAANSSMAINLLQRTLDQQASPRFIMVSSGAVYDSKQPLPIGEGGLLSHGSPYAVSKLSVEMMGDYYRSRGIPVVNVRPFNHFGPGQTPGFIVPDLLGKLLGWQQNQTPLSVGDLTTARDYTDVRDVARAYALLATSDQPPAEAVYNVCSSRSRTGQEILEALISALQLPEPPEIQVDQSLLRPNDARDIYGDNSRISQEFGWQPQVAFEASVRDTVEAARSH